MQDSRSVARTSHEKVSLYVFPVKSQRQNGQNPDCFPLLSSVQVLKFICSILFIPLFTHWECWLVHVQVLFIPSLPPSMCFRIFVLSPCCMAHQVQVLNPEVLRQCRLQTPLLCGRTFRWLLYQQDFSGHVVLHIDRNRGPWGGHCVFSKLDFLSIIWCSKFPKIDWPRE